MYTPLEHGKKGVVLYLRLLLKSTPDEMEPTVHTVVPEVGLPRQQQRLLKWVRNWLVHSASDEVADRRLEVESIETILMRSPYQLRCARSLYSHFMGRDAFGHLPKEVWD